MNSKILIVLLLIAQAASAIRLRNGVDVNQEKIDTVWHALEKLSSKEYYWLWRTCKDLQKQKIDALYELDYKKIYLKKFEEKEVNKLKELSIIADGKIDKEIQNIVISSYNGTTDPKIISKRYPVSFPRYALFKVKSLFSKS